MVSRICWALLHAVYNKRFVLHPIYNVRALRRLCFVHEISSCKQYVIWAKYGVYFIMDFTIIKIYSLSNVYISLICKYFLYKMRARMLTTGKTSERERKIECIHLWGTKMNWMKIGKTNESNISKLTVSNLSH